VKDLLLDVLKRFVVLLERLIFVFVDVDVTPG
jgi:hypothetical protein